MDCLYFYSWIKQILLREGLQGVERWSQGIIIGKLDPDSVGQADTQTMENERTALLNSLTKMRSRHVLVTSGKDEVQFVDGGKAGQSIVMEFLDYIDDCIMAVCTGAVLMSSKSNAGSIGSQSRDEVGRDTQRGVILYDKNKFDEDITSQLINLFERMNWKNYIQLGITNAGEPEFKTVGAKVVDPDAAAARFAQLAQLAQTTKDPIRVRRDEMFEQMDLTPTGPDDDVVEFGPPPAQPGMEGLGGGFPQNGAGQQPTEEGAPEGAGEEVPGGLAEGKDPSQFDPAALRKGTEVELEHTGDQQAAQEIAMDHLMEDPQYYEKLEQVEGGGGI